MTVWALWEAPSASNYQLSLLGLFATQKLAEKAQRARRKTAPYAVLRIEAIPVEE